MLSTLRIRNFTFRISKSVVSLKRQILLRESIFCNFIYIVFIIYIYKVLRIRNKLRAVRSPEGFYYTMFSIQSGHWCNSK